MPSEASQDLKRPRVRWALYNEAKRHPPAFPDSDRRPVTGIRFQKSYLFLSFRCCLQFMSTSPLGCGPALRPCFITRTALCVWFLKAHNVCILSFFFFTHTFLCVGWSTLVPSGCLDEDSVISASRSLRESILVNTIHEKALRASQKQPLICKARGGKWPLNTSCI